MISKHFWLRSLAVPLAVLSLAACEDSVSLSDTATVRILLTDAPAQYIGEAFVDIGAVELLSADGGARIVLSEDGTDGPVDLLDLEGLTTLVLADIDIPAGTYHELRLIVESASVTLVDAEFRDGSTVADLRVPSGAQTGIKLKLRSGAVDPDAAEDGAGVEISGGETVLVVDFDVHQSFRIQGNPSTPAGINSVSFQPTLRVVVRDVAGSISGTISTAADTPIEGLVVTAETVSPEGDPDFQTQTATAMTGTDGAYTIFFLAPGTYTVTVATPDGFTTDPVSVEDVVVDPSGDVTGIDFAIVPAG